MNRTVLPAGLKYLHCDAPVSLVHGDVKGANVMVLDVPGGGTVAKVCV